MGTMNPLADTPASVYPILVSASLHRLDFTQSPARAGSPPPELPCPARITEPVPSL
jgi:hypothetical protein